MNKSTVVFVINDDVRAVSASYEDTRDNPAAKSYLFKTFDQSVAVGDVVVVETNTRHGYTCAKITEVDVEFDYDTQQEIKWLVDVVEVAAHKQILKEEDETYVAVQSAERRRKREELRAAMFKDHEEKLGHLALASHSGSHDGSAEVIQPPVAPTTSTN